MGVNVRFKTVSYDNETMTDMNYLGATLRRQPALLDAFTESMTRNVAANTYGLMALLNGGLTNADDMRPPSRKAIGDDEFMWRLLGTKMTAVPIVGTVTPSSNIGINFTKFVIPFPKDWLSVRDICNLEDGHRVQVTRYLGMDGARHLYEFQLIGSYASSETIPAATVAVGKRVGFSDSGFEEMSKGGGVKGYTYEWTSNRLNILRQSYVISGSAASNEIQEVTFTTDSGAKTTAWIFDKHLKHMRDMYKQIARATWDSQSNILADGTSPNKGDNGRSILQGDGILRQISQNIIDAQGNIALSMFNEFAVDIHGHYTSEAVSRQSMLVTGNGGEQGILKMLEDAQIKFLPSSESYFINKEGDKLVLGAAYKGFVTNTGHKFIVVNSEMLNDQSVYPGLLNGRTIKGYDIYCVDMSIYNEGANIALIEKMGVDGQESRGITTWSTDGAVTLDASMNKKKSSTGFFGLRTASSDIDGLAVHMLSNVGVAVRNPEACAIIRYRPTL